MPKNTALSLEEALKLFTSWKEQSLAVEVNFSGGIVLPDNPATVRTKVEGTLSRVGRAGVSSAINVEGHRCTCEVDLRSATLTLLPLTSLQLLDPSGVAFEAALQAQLSNGEHCLFLVFRRAS